jgi:hypothetical protein
MSDATLSEIERLNERTPEDELRLRALMRIGACRLG